MDNTALNPGTGGDLIATDELVAVNGLSADPGLKVQRVKVGFGGDGQLHDVSPTAPMPVTDGAVQDLLQRLLGISVSPVGYDKSQQRYRQTAVIESGTITAVTAVAALNNLLAIGGYNAQMQVLDQNRAAWAACVRARIT